VSVLSSIPNSTEAAERAFEYPLEHLHYELHRLDLLIQREILRLRARYQLSRDESRGLYISDEQVDRLVNESVKTEERPEIISALTERAEALRHEYQRMLLPDLPWRRLAETFQLSAYEQDLLLVAIAPELDLKYETLYGYLNNDAARKYPTCDLAMRLLSALPSVRMVRRSLMLPDSPLFAHGILRWASSGACDKQGWLSGSISVSQAVVNFVLGQPGVSAELISLATLNRPQRTWSEVPIHQSVARELTDLPTAPGTILVFQGRRGAGRAAAAEAVATSFRTPILMFDAMAARVSGTPMVKLVKSLVLHQQLYGALICVTHGDVLLDKDAHAESSVCLELLGSTTFPVVICALPGGRWRELEISRRTRCIDFAYLACADRAAIWRDAAAQRGLEIQGDSLEAVADRFVLTPGQIEQAVDAVASKPANGLDPAAWLEAARSQSDHSLGQLAAKVRLAHGWRDLVLPAATLRHLKQITAAVRHRRRVYEDWGFERRVSLGKGLKLLFSGPSGTGKTMTASVMAQDLGLDLYKIDLSRIVSKYIGETEKNLDRIFLAAECSNAIVFFDEADALFGKRSEVKDAHDRYANVEVAYLLQKLEEHDGVVILATNLNKNIDEAFARRMHYVVRFPLPDAPDRERLWRGMFPAEAPLAADIDFEFVSTQFSFTGGEIKNIALDAAFRAAADGGIVTMAHMMRALAQQLMKEGRNPTVADFRHYHALLERS
jgi:AAA+ superfamily predicted ATPase